EPGVTAVREGGFRRADPDGVDLRAGAALFAREVGEVAFGGNAEEPEGDAAGRGTVRGRAGGRVLGRGVVGGRGPRGPEVDQVGRPGRAEHVRRRAVGDHDGGAVGVDARDDAAGGQVHVG